MRVIVGLGNPGKKYARTRHNAGFLLADALVSRWKLVPEKLATEADAFGGQFGSERVVVLKPTTYMNNSGDSLGFLSYQPFQVDRDLLVVCDDFALPLGTFRLRGFGSAGGHNGLVSVEQALQTRDYARLRIGVGPLPLGIGDWADFVLVPFEATEAPVLEELLPTMADAVECWVRDGIETAMQKYNRKAQPKDPG